MTNDFSIMWQIQTATRVVTLLALKATDITLLGHIAFPLLANQAIVAIKQVHC